MATIHAITFNGTEFGVGIKEVNVALDYGNIQHVEATGAAENYLLNNCNLLNKICRDVLGVSIFANNLFSRPIITASYTKALSLSLAPRRPRNGLHNCYTGRRNHVLPSYRQYGDERGGYDRFAKLRKFCLARSLSHSGRLCRYGGKRKLSNLHNFVNKLIPAGLRAKEAC